MRLGRDFVRDTVYRIYKGGCMEKQFDHVAHGDMPHFTYFGVTPSLNEYLAACNRNHMAGAKMKKDTTSDIGWCIRSDLKRWHTDNPLILHYVIYEPNTKRDHDNVFAMTSKCVQDALQECGVIPNDGWKNVLNFTHDFYLDRKNPRIEVYLEEIEEKEINE